MKELGAHLESTISKGLNCEDEELWGKILPFIHTDGLEAALLKHPPSTTLETKIAHQTAQLIAEKEKCVLREVLASQRTLRLTKLIKHLLKQPTGIPIITTNYDRLVEVAVEEAGLGADTMFAGRYLGRFDEKKSAMSFCVKAKLKSKTVSFEYQDRARIFKPHGSIDWYPRSDHPVQLLGVDLIDGEVPLIITPGQNKFRNGYEIPFDRHRNNANSAIDKASRFLIIGYGFNDEHLQTHLLPAITGGKQSVLITFEHSELAQKLALENSNVIGVDKSQSGTRVIIDKTSHEFAGASFWDLESFVKEVLE